MLSLLTFLLLAAPGGDAVVLRAGTIHLVQDGQVLTDSAILVKDGKIVAIGADLKTPLGVREVDYGPDATIVPGFVAADSPYGAGGSAERSAAPMLRAIDNFDPYSRYTSALSGGVTTCYLNPGVDRLIAGLGGVVKMKGHGSEDYLLLGASSIQGSISSSARNTSAFWEPPLPRHGGRGARRCPTPTTPLNHGCDCGSAGIVRLCRRGSIPRIRMGRGRWTCVGRGDFRRTRLAHGRG